MKTCIETLEGVSIFLLLIHLGHGYMVGDNPGHRATILDPAGKYHLEWRVDWVTKTICFNVTVKTQGWIFFGLANNADSSTGADGVIGGVLGNEKSYFLDGYLEDQRDSNLEIDSHQDYTLLSFLESGSQTFLSFSRTLDTCDPHDYPITTNKVTLLWGYGESDNYHHDTMIKYKGYIRGTQEIYLLDQEHSPRIVRNGNFGGTAEALSREHLSTWSIPIKIVAPANYTSYLCSIHRAPLLTRKHHVVGFDVHFADEISRVRTHHVLVYKCKVSKDWHSSLRSTFEPFIGVPAETCYFPQMPSTNHRSMPLHFCAEMYTSWAVGGGSYFNPPHVGFPLGSSTSSEEYYMVQVHYDNPQMSSNAVVDLKIDIFYTSKLRSHEGGILAMGHDVPGIPPSLIMPPNSINHRLFGHCSPECTKRIWPANEGVKFIASFLHAHRSGKSLRLRHFRRNQELPWILYDDNYNGQFQPFRLLRKERKVLPGDQLTVECSFDTTWANGSTIGGGFSTKQEMCMAFIIYYNRIDDYTYCTSTIVSPEFGRHFLQISNVSWSETLLDWQVTAPQRLAGLTMTEISDNHVIWDKIKRLQMQRFHEQHSHVGKCSKVLAELDAKTVQTTLNDIRRDNGFGGMLNGIVPQKLDTVTDHHSPVSYPFQTKPYSAPQTSCSFKGYQRLE